MIYLMRYSLILLIRNLQVDKASLELRVNKINCYYLLGNMLICLL
jgi:hypothetical protein